MKNKILNIVSVSAEVTPFSKTGGLADVASSLPLALKKLGHNVIAISPLYGHINKEFFKLKKIGTDIPINFRNKEIILVNFWQGIIKNNLLIYFVENKKYFPARKHLYYPNEDNERFYFFNIAVLILIKQLGIIPDIIQCHDWHTGLIPFILKNDQNFNELKIKTKTIFTIHNLVFQMGGNWWEVPKELMDNGKDSLTNIDINKIRYINFAKRGIIWSDAINTVSESYRNEILTKEFGQGLEKILEKRKNVLFGIINGIDDAAYNPKNDPGLYKNYDINNFEIKKENKLFFQKKLGLFQNIEIPLLSLTSRVTFQKGFELILPLLEHFIKIDIQLAILGDGDKRYINEIKKFAKKNPLKIVWLPFSGNEKLETMFYAGTDIFVLPSHHEPCGINQLIAMRYGCIPVVRRVGGLIDTVSNYNPKTGKGTGFSFSFFDQFSLFGAIIRAIEIYRHKNIWDKIIIRAMKESNGWEIPAKKYSILFNKLVFNRLL